MPVQHLPTGIDLYYESHGTGEPLVFIPATGFAGNVWLPDQMPELAESLQVIIFDPRVAAYAPRIQKQEGQLVSIIDKATRQLAQVRDARGAATFESMYDATLDKVLNGTGRETFDAVKLMQSQGPAAWPNCA